MNTLLAQMTLDVTPKGEFAKLGDITLPSFLSAAIRLTLVAAAIIFLFMLVLGGIRWMLSAGDKAGTEGARNQVTAALIGLLIIFVTWAILALVNTLFGVDLLGGLTIPSILPDSGGAIPLPPDCQSNPADPSCRP